MPDEPEEERPTRSRGQAQREARRWRWATLGLAAVLLLVVGHLTGASPDTDAGARQVAAAASLPESKLQAQLTKDQATLESCEQLAGNLAAMAKFVDDAFEEHADAHHLWKQGKMRMGSVDEPHTVLWVWRKTLADRERYSPLYRKAVAAWDKQCVT